MNIKKISMIALTVATLMCVASCDKDKSRTVLTFKATAERSKDDMKVSLSGGQLRWSNGDGIKVYDSQNHWGNYVLGSAEGSAIGTFNYSPSRDGTDNLTRPYYAVYPARFFTGRNEVTLPYEQYTTDGRLRELPMYATSTSENLEFYNICGVVRFRLTASSSVNLRCIAVTTNAATNGKATIIGSGTSMTLGPLSDGSTTVLLCETAQNIASAHDFYMYLPAGNYSTFNIRMTTDHGLSCTMGADRTITVQRSKIITITLTNLNFTEPPILPGEFSVANGRKVRFSKGNLQYIGSAVSPYWKFAEHQYDYIGKTPNQNSDLANADRDLFGWGTSGWNNGNNYYMPYNTSNTWDDSRGYGYGPTDGSTCTYSLTGSYANSDWGVYNAIQNGGNVAGMWRTLTGVEWNYLLNTRANATAKAGYATVAGVHGIILLPDNFTDPMKNNGSMAFVPKATTGWDANVYTAGNWTAMELAGAVFLPAAGGRFIDKSIDFVTSQGYYWSSSHAGSGYAYSLCFSNTSLYTTSGYRMCGYSVRLVQN